MYLATLVPSGLNTIFSGSYLSGITASFRVHPVSAETASLPVRMTKTKAHAPRKTTGFGRIPAIPEVDTFTEDEWPLLNVGRLLLQSMMVVRFRVQAFHIRHPITGSLVDAHR